MKGIIILLFLSLGCFGEDIFPDRIHFRDKSKTFNSKYNFVLKEGKLWIGRRLKDGSTKENSWKELFFHEDLKEPFQISADSGHLIVIDSKLRIFSTRDALSDDIEKIKEFIKKNLKNNRFTNIKLKASNKKLEIKKYFKFKWELEAN